MLPQAIVTDDGCISQGEYTERWGYKGLTCQSMKGLKKKGKLPIEVHKVRSICGSSMREMVRVSAKGHEVLADVITGSLYDIETGICFTGNLRIVGG